MGGTALVTGSAGFIGFHMSRRLLDEGARVIGLDGMTDYYDVSLKRARHALLEERERFEPVVARLEEPGLLDALLQERRPEWVIHLAAQAGVRHSIEAPESYVDSNLLGTFRVLEAARRTPPSHLMIASTSSVYGANESMPYAERQKADLQMSFYAATKKACEAMAHSYAHLHALPTTAFRFFTVYGPWGRPDMALFRLVRAISAGETFELYNRGEMSRDFTYVDDLVEGLARLRGVPPGEGPVSEADSLSPVAPFRVVNVGNSTPTRLGDFVRAVEVAMGRKAKVEPAPMQPGDVPATWADATLLADLVGAIPRTPLEDGVANFVEWYRGHYGPSGVPDGGARAKSRPNA